MSQNGSQPRYGDIQRLAYQIWEQRGRPAGSADDNWLFAQQLLRENGAVPEPADLPLSETAPE